MKITIEKTEEKGWSVKMGDKYADHLTWDEMFGLVASLTLPDNRPCKQWLRTKMEHKAQHSYFKKMAKRNNVNPPEKAQNQ